MGALDVIGTDVLTLGVVFSWYLNLEPLAKCRIFYHIVSLCGMLVYLPRRTG
jgi:hypothetical protein